MAVRPKKYLTTEEVIGGVFADGDSENEYLENQYESEPETETETEEVSEEEESGE